MACLSLFLASMHWPILVFVILCLFPLSLSTMVVTFAPTVVFVFGKLGLSSSPILYVSGFSWGLEWLTTDVWPHAGVQMYRRRWLSCGTYVSEVLLPSSSGHRNTPQHQRKTAVLILIQNSIVIYMWVIKHSKCECFWNTLYNAYTPWQTYRPGMW
jgi:hypothetical protein